jgi:hypothetical protein
MIWDIQTEKHSLAVAAMPASPLCAKGDAGVAATVAALPQKRNMKKRMVRFFMFQGLSSAKRQANSITDRRCA